jgi:hypothetical protein
LEGLYRFLCDSALVSIQLGSIAASLYIVVEGEDPGFDTFVNGHALARNEDALERLAERLSVRPLLDYFSADQDFMALLLEQGAGNPETERRRAIVVQGCTAGLALASGC